MCKPAPRSRQITMPAPHCSVFYRPDALPVAQPTASKHWRHPLKTQWTVNSINYKVLRKNRVLLLILSWSTNGLLRERSPYLLNAGSLMPVSCTASISLKTIDTWTQISSVIYATIYFVTQHSRVSTVVTYCASASVLARSLHSWLIDALEFSDKSIGFSNRWSQLRLFTARCSSSRR